ncbi:MAG TPA: hypothetical protein PK264_08575 [Hyphomicrobiaceae bacterium]|nr:hypothetical protein [Hyphomicrobiaceae bacterium]
MRIGIDFDNTLACYDGVFHAAALERELIPRDLPSDKTSVRDYLRAEGQDPLFTELQGYVYGARMDLVAVYPGAFAALAALKSAGHELAIVSHKTREPFAGPRYDLHAAARGFLVAQRLAGPGGLIDDARVHFELTKEAKVARAAALGCEVFIDDLPEILAMPGYPPGLRAILFDPDGHYDGGRWKQHSFERHRSWAEIGRALGVGAA